MTIDPQGTEIPVTAFGRKLTTNLSAFWPNECLLLVRPDIR